MLKGINRIRVVCDVHYLLCAERNLLDPALLEKQIKNMRIYAGLIVRPVNIKTPCYWSQIYINGIAADKHLYLFGVKTRLTRLTNALADNEIGVEETVLWKPASLCGVSSRAGLHGNVEIALNDHLKQFFTARREAHQ